MPYGTRRREAFVQRSSWQSAALLLLVFGCEADSSGGHHSPARTRVQGLVTPCDAGQVAFEGRCYKALDQVESWSAARSRCAALGAGWDLATIASAEQNAFLVSLAQGESRWIGLTDEADDGDWVWIHGDPPGEYEEGDESSLPFTAWDVGFPDDQPSSRTYGRLMPDGKWRAQNAQGTYRSICQSPSSSAAPANTIAPDEGCERLAHGSSVYWRCEEERTWSDARQRCQSIGMDLTKIETHGENEFLSDQLGSDNDHWIGATDGPVGSASEGQWHWVVDDQLFWIGDEDGAAQGGAFTSWDSSDPDDDTDDNCARIYDDAEWKDKDCSDKEDYICETVDRCPADPDKQDAGFCGCGVPDTDSNHDRMPDCLDDLCPPGTKPVALSSGDDVHSTSAESECVLALSGSDQVSTNNATVSVRGGDGDDIITLAMGGVAAGDGGDDTIVVQAGSGNIWPGAGADNVVGGSGDDIVLVAALCEVQPGERLDGGAGTDVLITPVPVADLQAAGATVVGFEEIRIKTGTECVAACTPASNCPPCGLDDPLCTESAAPTWSGGGSAPPTEFRPPKPPPVSLLLSYQQFQQTLSAHFPFLNAAGTMGGRTQYHAYSDNMRALLRLEGDATQPSVARLFLFDRIGASATHLSTQSDIVYGFLQAAGAETQHSDIMAFLGDPSGPSLEQRTFSRSAWAIKVVNNRDYGMAVLELILGNHEFVWGSNGGAVSMGPSASRACFFTRIAGRFFDDPEHIEIAEAVSEWYLRGASDAEIPNEQELQAKARCFGSPGIVAEGYWHQHDQSQPQDLGPEEGRVCFLTRVKGGFWGGGERVAVERIGGRWVLHGSSLQSKSERALSASARCVAADDASPQFLWTKQADSNGGATDPPVDMGPSLGRLCFLTSLHGNLEGLGERVQITQTSSDPKQSHWTLHGNSQQPDILQAGAVCFTP